MPPPTNSKPKSKRKGKKHISKTNSSSVAGPADQAHEQGHGPTPGPSNAAAYINPQLSSTSRSSKQRSSRKFASRAGSSASATAGLKMEEDFTEELASQIESAFHIKDETNVELAMPVVSEESETIAHDGFKKEEDVTGKGKEDENTAEQLLSPKGNGFKRRLREFTGSSPKSSSSGLGSDCRHSWQTRSRSFTSLGASSAGSDSLTTRDANLASGSSAAGGVAGSLVSPQKRPSIAGKRSFTSPSAPLKLKYISPTDYMLVDMNLPEPRPAPKAPEPGLLPKMKDAAQQVIGKKPDSAKPSKRYHQTALHIKNVDGNTPEASSKRQELIEYARSVTGTEVKFRDLNHPNAKQRKDDVRVWDTVNLRCISCRGDCPVCGGACCLYADASKAVADENADAEKVGKAKRIVEVVESLSPQVMDVGTYQLCSQPGGCGRYVCPSCCGVCPNEICRDVQCKECKEDPWGACDWHD